MQKGQVGLRGHMADVFPTYRQTRRSNAETMTTDVSASSTLKSHNDNTNTMVRWFDKLVLAVRAPHPLIAHACYESFLEYG